MSPAPRLHARPARSQRAASACVAASFLVVMLGTTLPTPLYVLYQREMGFSTLLVTVIFAAYAVGVLAALLVLGRASDVIGRRRALLAGLGCAALSGVGFLLAHDLLLLLVARVLSGLSAGIFTGTATAALVDLGEDPVRATLLGTVANMGGLGAGPPLAGLVAQLGPAPLRTPFVVHLALVAIVTTAVWLMPEPSVAGRLRDVRMARLSIPASTRGVFVGSAVAGFAGFAVLGLFTAVVPVFLRTLMGVPDPAFAGLVVGGLFAASTFGQVVVVHLGPRAMPVGCAVLALGALLLAAAIGLGSLTLLLLAVVVAGTGQGTTFRSAITLLNAAAPPERRAEVASSFFVVAYVAIAVPVVGEGVVSQSLGLRTAGVGFALGVAALAATAALDFAASRRRTAPTPR